MGESRQELISWVNDLLQFNYTKVEQMGTGAAYCQIIDSIYLNVPLSKVKMNAKHEYEFIGNYKILQETFKRNRIEKPIPVERLIKCKMQDNLEFLQWIKKFWDTNFPGQAYDPVARRAGRAGDPAPLHGATTVGGVHKATGVKKTVGGAPRAPGAGTTGAVPNAALEALTGQMEEMKLSVDNLEKERDFYFSKLRDIEVLVQAQLDSSDAAGETGPVVDVLKQIQAILYSTEEGFEVPEGAGPALDEEETF